MESAQTDETKAAFEAKYQKKAALLQQQNKAYNQYCEDTGLKKQSDRISIAKWDRSQAAKATAVARKYNIQQEIREKNLQFIENDAKIKKTSGLPSKIKEADTAISHTVDVNLPKLSGVVPKGSTATDVYTMAGGGTSTPIRDLKRLYTMYPEYGDAAGWKKVSGTVYAKHHHYVVHWYQNNGKVPKTEIKLKGAK